MAHTGHLACGIAERPPCSLVQRCRDTPATEQGPFSGTALKMLQQGTLQGKLQKQYEQVPLARSIKFTILTVISLSVLIFPFCVASAPFLLPCCNLSPFIAFLLDVYILY